MQSTVDYAIVGAGAIGTCCALLLAQLTNKKVALIGKPSIPDTPQRTYALNRVSQTLLDVTGTWQQLDAVPYTSMEVIDIETGIHLMYKADEHNEPDLGHTVTDSNMAQILSDQASENDRIIWLPWRLQNLVRHKDNTQLILEDGSALYCKLLIAADGKYSHIASLCGIKAKHRPTGDTSIVSVLQLSRKHNYCARQWFSHQSVIAILPLRDNRQAALVWSTNEKTASTLMLNSSDELGVILTKATLGHLGAISLNTSPVSFEISQHNLASYCQPGLVFIGDAAHSVHPLAGQGMNMGLQDLFELARQLIIRENESVSQEYVSLFNLQQSRHIDNLANLALFRTLQKVFRSNNPTTQIFRMLATKAFQDNHTLKRYVINRALYGGLAQQDLETVVRSACPDQSIQ